MSNLYTARYPEIDGIMRREGIVPTGYSTFGSGCAASGAGPYWPHGFGSPAQSRICRLNLGQHPDFGILMVEVDPTDPSVLPMLDGGQLDELVPMSTVQDEWELLSTLLPMWSQRIAAALQSTGFGTGGLFSVSDADNWALSVQRMARNGVLGAKQPPPELATCGDSHPDMRDCGAMFWRAEVPIGGGMRRTPWAMFQAYALSTILAFEDRITNPIPFALTNGLLVGTPPGPYRYRLTERILADELRLNVAGSYDNKNANGLDFGSCRSEFFKVEFDEDGLVRARSYEKPVGQGGGDKVGYATCGQPEFVTFCPNQRRYALEMDGYLWWARRLLAWSRAHPGPEQEKYVLMAILAARRALTSLVSIIGLIAHEVGHNTQCGGHPCGHHGTLKRVSQEILRAELGLPYRKRFPIHPSDEYRNADEPSDDRGNVIVWKQGEFRQEAPTRIEYRDYGSGCDQPPTEEWFGPLLCNPRCPGSTP